MESRWEARLKGLSTGCARGVFGLGRETGRAGQKQGTRWVECAWELWKAKMFKAADRGIGKK